MNLFQFIHCGECGMEYQIIWDDDNFQQPIKCCGCGADEPQVIILGLGHNNRQQSVIFYPQCEI